MALNSGDHAGEMAELPGVTMDPRSGAGPGSVTEAALTNEGPALGTYRDTGSGFISTQETNLPERTVYAGDTFGGGNDRPVPAAFGTISGGVPAEDQMSTGAGKGHIAANNPDSMWGRGPETSGRY